MSTPADKEAKKAAKQAKQGNKQQQGGNKNVTVPTTVNQEGISVKKSENFSQWYQEVVTKCELVEYYTEISGFYILRR